MSAAAELPRTPHPLLAPLGRVLEAALNRAIDLDVDTRGRLDALHGRSVQVDFGDGGRVALPALRIDLDHGRVRIGPVRADADALGIAATPFALARFALAAREGATTGRVSIRGDAELAQRLQRITQRFAPDIDEAFAAAFGDVLGVRIARMLRAAFAGMRAGMRGLLEDTAGFLAEEGRDLVPRAELDAFLDDVDALRERGERIEARVRRLQATPAAGRA